LQAVERNFIIGLAMLDRMSPISEEDCGCEFSFVHFEAGAALRVVTAR